MEEAAFEQWAKGVAQKNDFIIDQRLHIGTYYRKDHVRSMVFSGTYAYQKAMLKVYNDPRGSDEANAITQFAAHNSSEKIKPPELLASKTIDAHSGWFVSKTRDTLQEPFVSPLTADSRTLFLSLYKEYRTHVPTEPIRQLQLREYLPAHEFHTLRLSQWFALAMAAERDRKKRLLDPSELIPRYTRVIDEIRTVFASKKMVWCHGHFKPNSLLFDPQTDAYTIVDFAHAGMYPEGYELAFMVWADALADGDYSQDYTQWRAHIDGWLDDIAAVAQDLGMAGDDYDDVIHASMLERLMGTILADVASSDMPRETMVTKLNYLHRLYDQIM